MSRWRRVEAAGDSRRSGERRETAVVLVKLSAWPHLRPLRFSCLRLPVCVSCVSGISLSSDGTFVAHGRGFRREGRSGRARVCWSSESRLLKISGAGARRVHRERDDADAG
ncbi:hypothetical protein AAFF_G00340550 [Aldrovandia affinis]|uniref:Uncharacterized protein n=1 Tax=Aldrovandia affinis TaxID=143900 RepID=A0AAD7SKG4_9TELE|nr:hypothetical protein AAFF_G00340550 [Aldrovandia affinis]